MRLLLATDGSSDATEGIVAAARAFGRDDVEVDLLTVVPNLDLPNAPVGSKRLLGQVRKAYRTRMKGEAERVLSGALEALRAEGVSARSRVEDGSVADVILACGAAYDVVAVGAHDRFGRTQPGVGPIGTQVIMRTGVSVFVGREGGQGPPSRILVCVDGSAGSTQALDRLRAWVRTDRSEVDLIHVVEWPWLRLGCEPEWLTDEGILSEEQYAAFSGCVGEESRRIVAEASRTLELDGISAAPIFKDGLPEAQILSQAEVGGYDLIVLGAGGRSGADPGRVGSVAVRVAENAPASVWVVR